MEKLTELDFRESTMIAKINELVDYVNELQEELFEGVTPMGKKTLVERIDKMEHHYHAIEAQDRDITTEPRYEQ